MKRIARLTTLCGLGLTLGLQPLELLAATAPLAHGAEPMLIARGGGGSKRSGGGSKAGSGSRGASRSGGGSGARTGFSSFGGGGSRGGSGSRAQSGNQLRQNTSQNRQSNIDQRSGNRQANVDSRSSNRNSAVSDRQNGRTDRTDIRQTNMTDRSKQRNKTARENWDNRANYWGSGWNTARPWNYGWYGGSTYNSWGWWPGQAAAWGIAGLATGAVITGLVNSAISSQSSYIAVPSSNYQLDYTTIQGSGDVVTFQAFNGNSTVYYTANCRQGLLNGNPPRSGDEAQLLNAACQVGFGR